MRISEKNMERRLRSKLRNTSAIIQGILIGLTNGLLMFLGVMVAFYLIGLIQ